MKNEKFMEVVSEQLTYCELLLRAKGHEYAPDAVEASEVDRLDHFKVAAQVAGLSPKQALWGMLTKHLVSLRDMCADVREHEPSTWEEKITDSINYLLLLKALVTEEVGTE